MEFLHENVFQRQTDAALAWLRQSLEATGGAGFSHHFSPIFGWARGYPETTGYLIETLFDFAAVKNDDSLRQMAFEQTDWLCKIQLPSGAWQAGVFGKKSGPSAFNTGQILFGLARSIQETNDSFLEEKWLAAGKKATDWLLSILENNGSWLRANYVANFCPTYHTRAVWGVLKMNQHVENQKVTTAMRRALDFYANRLTEENSFEDWGFMPQKAAPTHTIAYTIRGFLECGVLLDDPILIGHAAAVFDKLKAIRRINHGRTAGEYFEDWRGNYDFKCVTGNCQLSIIASRFFQLTNDEKYCIAAHEFLAEVMDSQRLTGRDGIFGALPGSMPFYGRYMRLRYPNWAAKFFLDALLLLKNTSPIDFSKTTIQVSKPTIQPNS